MKFFSLFDPKTEFDFVGKMGITTKIGFIIPIVAIVSMIAPGIPWGLDFQGGTEMQVKFTGEVTEADVRGVLAAAGFEKNQVQRYGSVDNREMLIRVERVTSLTDDHVKTVESLLKDNFDKSLRLGGEKTAADIVVKFGKDEGDRITISLPTPRPQAGAKNTDAAAIDAALAAKKATEGFALDDAALEALSKEGFDRAAVVDGATRNGIAVTASIENQAEADLLPAVALHKALEAQELALAKLIDEKSGLKLRRTKRTGETEATFEDSIVRDEPYQGLVKYLVQFRGVSADIERALRERFGDAEIRRVEFVDATVAKQLQTDGAFAVLIALLFILLYVAIRFDIFFSPGAVIALGHDAFGATLLFTLGRLEFELPSVAALLTVIGYSINNTIVIYDRIRETVPTDPKSPLTDDQVKGFVNKAVNDTFSRTVNTTITTLLTCVALAVFATGVVQNFAMVLIAGFSLGAFSSVFLAPATYLFFRRNFHNPEAKKSVAEGLSREDKARGVV